MKGTAEKGTHKKIHIPSSCAFKVHPKVYHYRPIAARAAPREFTFTGSLLNPLRPRRDRVGPVAPHRVNSEPTGVESYPGVYDLLHSALLLQQPWGILYIHSTLAGTVTIKSPVPGARRRVILVILGKEDDSQQQQNWFRVIFPRSIYMKVGVAGPLGVTVIHNQRKLVLEGMGLGDPLHPTPILV